MRKDHTIEESGEVDVSPVDELPSGDSSNARSPGLADANSAESLQRELAEYKDKLLRAQAECVNISKRLHQQQIEAVRFAPMGIAREMLDVLDNLNRSLANMETGQADGAMIDGVRLIADQLAKVLKDHGVTPIESVGRPFDPTIHEAMMSDANSELPPGTVTSELVRGYKMNDRVLRPAKVMVSAQQSDGAE